ncbi:flagellin hook IN motif-containing protein, partial [Proteus faecis]|uniref:flagellin hook IN motif-containing protein n=1 Tax=Proteus faecis TaxID=2050967 RepID=UPI003075B4A8
AFDLTIAKGADPTAAGAKTTKISLAGGATLNDVARAITDSDAGVNATVVQVKEGTYRLQLTSKDTGAASNVTLTDGN